MEWEGLSMAAFPDVVRRRDANASRRVALISGANVSNHNCRAERKGHLLSLSGGASCKKLIGGPIVGSRQKTWPEIRAWA